MMSVPGYGEQLVEFGVLTSFAYLLEDGSGEWVAWRGLACWRTVRPAGAQCRSAHALRLLVRIPGGSPKLKPQSLLPACRRDCCGHHPCGDDAGGHSGGGASRGPTVSAVQCRTAQYIAAVLHILRCCTAAMRHQPFLPLDWLPAGWPSHHPHHHCPPAAATRTCTARCWCTLSTGAASQSFRMPSWWT